MLVKQVYQVGEQLPVSIGTRPSSSKGLPAEAGFQGYQGYGPPGPQG